MPETLFLTVNLIDRFLEVKQVTRRNLQLVSTPPPCNCTPSVSRNPVTSRAYIRCPLPFQCMASPCGYSPEGCMLCHRCGLASPSINSPSSFCPLPPSPQVGVTCMLIGSKYEEIWAPEVRDFVYISDKAYTREQILECEKLVLNTLKFHLTLPTSYNFLARFLKAQVMHLDRTVSLLASYLVELAVVDAGMLKYR